MLPCTWKTPARQGREELSGRQEPSAASGLNTAACQEDQQNKSPSDIVNSEIDPSGSLLVAPDLMVRSGLGLFLERTQEAGIRSKTS